MISQIPQLETGGYWLIVEADTTEGTTVPIEGSWCANYGTVDGVVYAAVRVLSPVVVPEVPVTFEQVIAVAVSEGGLPGVEKFHARIGAF